MKPDDTHGDGVYLTCDCCKFVRRFDDLEAAFDAGWDAPPRFTGYVACDLCPGSFIVLGEKYRHASVHERWEREGRPAEFTQETCIAPEDRVPQETLDAELKRLLDGSS